jgi:signal peptidase II
MWVFTNTGGRAAGLAFLLDQASKDLVIHTLKLGQSVPLAGNWLELTYVQNPGAAFGFLASARSFWRVPFFILVTVAATLLVYAYQRFLPPEKKLDRLALGLIWGGAMGNFMDRLLVGRVIDFIDVGYGQYRWPVFNLADSCITLGLGLLILGHFFKKKTTF